MACVFIDLTLLGIIQEVITDQEAEIRFLTEQTILKMTISLQSENMKRKQCLAGTHLFSVTNCDCFS